MQASTGYHENGAYVLDTKTSQSSSEQYVQLVISSNKLERALSQAANEYKRKRTLETEEHEWNLDQPDKKAAKQLAKPHKQSKSGRNRRSETVSTKRGARSASVPKVALDNTGGRNLTRNKSSDRVRPHIRDRSSW